MRYRVVSKLFCATYLHTTSKNSTSMPPAAARNGSKNNALARDRRSSSRQSTPLSTIDSGPPTPPVVTPSTVAPTATSDLPRETAYIHTPTSALVSTDATVLSLIDGSNGTTSKNDPPSARNLLALHDAIKETVTSFMAKRGEICDRSMRQLAQKRKERQQKEREEEAEEAARVKRREDEEAERKKNKKAGKKRSREEMEVDEAEVDKKERRDSLPSVGAHGVARQDGVGVHQGTLQRRVACAATEGLVVIHQFMPFTATHSHLPSCCESLHKYCPICTVRS